MDTPLSKSVSINVKTVNPHPNKMGQMDHEMDVYIPKSFPEPGEDPLWMFKPYEIRYLDALHRGDDPEKAIQDSGITQKHLTWLLRRKKARDYLGQLLRQKMAAEAWTQDKWISEGTQVWEGKKDASREQMEAWKELGARVCPKPERSRDGSEKVVININVGKVEAALERQKIIEVKAIESNSSDRILQGSLQEKPAFPL